MSHEPKSEPLTPAQVDKKMEELALRMTTSLSRLPQRRHTPLNGKLLKTSAPSRLSSLEGDRRPGPTVRHYATTKAPKRRFNLGDRFQYDGGVWELIYMYRVRSEPGLWFHCLEEQEALSENQEFIANGFEALGAGVTTPRIVFSEFPSHTEARDYFRDIYMRGSHSVKSTPELLKLKKVS
jgi:hypothetical protein